MKRPMSLRAAFVAMMLVFSVAVPAWADTLHPALVAQAGTTAELAFDINNETAQQHSYELTATGLPSGVTVQFVQDDSLVTGVDAEPNTAVPVSLRVHVATGAQIGSVELTFVARRDDEVTIEAPFTLDVRSIYALSITGAPKNASAFSGQEFGFDVTVTNGGAASATNLQPVLDMPSKWVMISDPPSIASLDPGGEAVFHLMVTVPASQVAIDQPVSVSVSSDQTLSEAVPVAVRVQSNPVYLPVAGGVVLAALAAVIIYFRRKGRR